MSALLYGALTRRRNDQASGASTTSGSPGVGTYLDAVAALVPAEVLAVHAVILPLVTTSNDGKAGITDVPTLRVVFWVLLVLSAALYLVGRKSLKNLDLVRVLIPPAAFVVWTMLQKVTAFDAVAPHMASTVRSVTAVLAALVLGVVAAQLGMVADKASPPGSNGGPSSAEPAHDALRDQAGDPTISQATGGQLGPSSYSATSTGGGDQSSQQMPAGESSVPGTDGKAT